MKAYFSNGSNWSFKRIGSNFYFQDPDGKNQEVGSGVFVSLTGAQTIAGTKTFTGVLEANSDFYVGGYLFHDGTTVGFYGEGPTTQPSSTGTTSGFTAGAGTAVLSDSTFTGGSGSTAYTLGDIVLHLKTLGLIAP